MNSDPILQVENLSIGFAEEKGGITSVVDGISFNLRPGEIYGLVGESGCGKTVTSLAILRLLPVPAGKIISGAVRFRDQDILQMTPAEVRNLRGSGISMIFQEPGAALNPVITIGGQLLEIFEYHAYKGEPGARCLEMLDNVGFPDPELIMRSYPHELSGGMAQRVMIAMALLLEPDLIIADEPTTALDVTVQAQIMELLMELRDRTGTAILLITHNLGLIAQYADRVAVMYAGRIAEESPVEVFLRDPLHPYSRGLIAAIPDLAEDEPVLRPIPGFVPKPSDFPVGCRFQDRCDQAKEMCHAQPALKKVGSDHNIACFLY